MISGLNEYSIFLIINMRGEKQALNLAVFVVHSRKIIIYFCIYLFIVIINIAKLLDDKTNSILQRK